MVDNLNVEEVIEEAGTPAPQQRAVSSGEAYFREILDKFNKDPNDPTLEKAERILLTQIQAAQKSISEIAGQIDTLNEEIKERQQKNETLVQQLIHLQGKSQGFVDSLLALR